MLPTVIESQLSRYGIPQKLNVTNKKSCFTLWKYRDSSNMTLLAERERGVWSSFGLFCIFGQSLLFSLTRARVICELSLTTVIKMNYHLLLMTQTLKETRWSLWYIKATTVRDSEIISISGRVRLIIYPYNGFNSVRLIGIRVIESQNAFY